MTDTKNSSDEAVGKVHHKAAQEAKTRHTHSVRRNSGEGDNQTFIDVNVCDATGEHTEQGKIKKEREKALARAAKSFSKALQAQMDRLDAMLVHYQNMAEQYRAEAATIRNSDKYLNTAEALTEFDDLKQNYDREKALALLNRHGAELSDNASDADIKAKLKAEEARLNAILGGLEADAAAKEARAAEYDEYARLVGVEKDRLIKNEELGIPLEDSLKGTPEEIRALPMAGIELEGMKNIDAGSEFAAEHKQAERQNLDKNATTTFSFGR